MTHSSDSSPLLLCQEQAAQLLGISKRTLYRLIQSGEFPRPIKVGSAKRVPMEDIHSYIDKQRRQRSA